MSGQNNQQGQPAPPSQNNQQGQPAPPSQNNQQGRFKRALKSHTFWHICNATVTLLIGVALGIFGPLGYSVSTIGVDISRDGIRIADTANILAKQESCRNHPNDPILQNSSTCQHMPTADEFDQIRRRGIDEWLAANYRQSAPIFNQTTFLSQKLFLDVMAVYTDYSPGVTESLVCFAYRRPGMQTLSVYNPALAAALALSKVCFILVRMVSFGFMFWISGCTVRLLIEYFQKRKPSFPSGISSESQGLNGLDAGPEASPQPFMDVVARISYQCIFVSTSRRSLIFIGFGLSYLALTGRDLPLWFSTSVGAVLFRRNFEAADPSAPDFNQLKRLLRAKIRRKRSKSEFVFWLYVCVEVVVLTLIWGFVDGPGILRPAMACYWSFIFLIYFNTTVVFADDWREKMEKIA